MPNEPFDSLIVRAATPGEASTLSAIAQEAKALWGYDPAWLEAWRPELTLTETDVTRMLVRVAESGGEIAGFAAVDCQGGVWEIAHLWVRPRFGRQGAGRRLLEAVVEAAREAGARMLRIEADPHAERFYLDLGAVRIGTRPASMPGAPARTLPVLELPVSEGGA